MDDLSLTQDDLGNFVHSPYAIFLPSPPSPNPHPQPKSQIGAGSEANAGPPGELQTAVVGCEEEAHSAFTAQTAQCELEAVVGFISDPGTADLHKGLVPR